MYRSNSNNNSNNNSNSNNNNNSNNNYNRRKILGHSAAIASSIALPGISLAAATPTSGDLLTVGCQNPRTLNPAVQSGNVTGMPGAQLFAGLVLLDAAFQPVPYLAKSWETSSDGLVYRFNLVENALFHDGRPVTAKDVVFSVNAVKENHPLMSVTYKVILESVAAVGKHTVEIRLKRPFTGLFGLLTPPLTPILPEHVYGEHAGPLRNNPANDKPVGSGPYRLLEWQRSAQLRMTRADNFFAGTPFFQNLAFVLSEDSLSKTLMLEKGEIDYLPFSFLRVTDLSRLESNKNLVLTRKGYDAIGPINYLEFNLRVKPLDNLLVRQAIAHAIDKNFITSRLHRGLSKPLHGPFHSDNFYYDEAALQVYDYNLEKANALLDQAGLKPNAQGIRATFTLDVPTFEPDSMTLVADYLKPQLRRVGIDINLRKSSDFASWAKRIGSWDFEMTMNSTFNWSDPAVGVDRSFLSSNIKEQVWTNTAAYANDQVDQWLAQAAAEADPIARKALYAKFQKQVTSDLPFVWTNEGIYVTVYNKKLTNIPMGVFGGLTPYSSIRYA